MENLSIGKEPPHGLNTIDLLEWWKQELENQKKVLLEQKVNNQKRREEIQKFREHNKQVRQEYAEKDSYVHMIAYCQNDTIKQIFGRSKDTLKEYEKLSDFDVECQNKIDSFEQDKINLANKYSAENYGKVIQEIDDKISAIKIKCDGLKKQVAQKMEIHDEVVSKVEKEKKKQQEKIDDLFNQQHEIQKRITMMKMNKKHKEMVKTLVPKKNDENML